MDKQFVISINGQNAVNAGYSFQRGRCYSAIKDGGKWLAQLEVVVDEPGNYNGHPKKWVDVSGIKSGRDVETVLNFLAVNGFSGCPCMITEETQGDYICSEKELFCCII